MRIESWIDIIIIMTPLRKVYVRTTPNNVFLSVWRPSEKFLKLFVSNGFFFVCGERGEEEGGHFYYAKILRQPEILNFKRFTSLSWSLLQKIFFDVIDIHGGHWWVGGSIFDGKIMKFKFVQGHLHLFFQWEMNQLLGPICTSSKLHVLCRWRLVFNYGLILEHSRVIIIMITAMMSPWPLHMHKALSTKKGGSSHATNQKMKFKD